MLLASGLGVCHPQSKPVRPSLQRRHRWSPKPENPETLYFVQAGVVPPRTPDDPLSATSESVSSFRDMGAMSPTSPVSSDEYASPMNGCAPAARLLTVCSQPKQAYARRHQSSAVRSSHGTEGSGQCEALQHGGCARLAGGAAGRPCHSQSHGSALPAGAADDAWAHAFSCTLSMTVQYCRTVGAPESAAASAGTGDMSRLQSQGSGMNGSGMNGSGMNGSGMAGTARSGSFAQVRCLSHQVSPSPALIG